MIVQLKGNQPQLFEAVQQLVAEQAPAAQTSEVTQGRNRLEARAVSIFDAAPLFASHPPLKPWSKRVESIIYVQRETACFDTRSGEWPVRSEDAYYIATTTFAAEQAAAFTRGHWAVENQNHYVRDVTLQEDASRIRRNPGIVFRLRSFALNILRKNHITNVSQALYDNALNLNLLKSYVGLF